MKNNNARTPPFVTMRVSNIHPTFSERRANYDNDNNNDYHDHDNDNYDSGLVNTDNY